MSLLKRSHPVKFSHSQITFSPSYPCVMLIPPVSVTLCHLQVTLGPVSGHISQASSYQNQPCPAQSSPRIPLSRAKPPLYVRTHIDCSWATVFPPLVSPGVPLLSYMATESWIPQSHRALVNLSPLPPLSHCTSPPLSLMWLKPTPHVFLEHSPHANFPVHRSP